MLGRRLRAVFVFFSAAGALTACSLSVTFDGSRYACDPPAGECPQGYTCKADGYCAPIGNLVVDSGVADADLLLPDGPPGQIDAAGQPDAPVALTRTFGERPGSMIQGVTSDAELDNLNPNGNYGAAAEFFCDNIDDRPPQNGASGLRNGLLRFNLSSIPVGATVLSASLELWTGNDPLDQGTVQWFKLNEDWTEGTSSNGAAGFANFLQRKNGTLWSTPGAGAPLSSASSFFTQLATPDPATGYTFAIPASVIQSWVNAPGSNFGMVCFVSPGVQSDSDFKAKDSVQSDHRPELTVTYVP